MCDTGESENEEESTDNEDDISYDPKEECSDMSSECYIPPKLKHSQIKLFSKDSSNENCKPECSLFEFDDYISDENDEDDLNKSITQIIDNLIPGYIHIVLL